MSEFEYVRNSWYPVGFSHEFKAGALASRLVAGRRFVIWRPLDGRPLAGFDDRCCHKRFPMSEGKLLPDGTLRCAYHGLRYDSSGRCVEIPAQADKPIPAQAHLLVAPTCEQDGVVWLWPGNADLSTRTGVPKTPEVNSADVDAVCSSGPINVPANYILLIENLLDITHFFPLHDGNIGDAANSKVPVQFEDGRRDDGNVYIKTIRKVEHYHLPEFYQDWFGYDEVDREHTHCMESPGLTRVVLRVAPHGQLGSGKERGYTILHLHYPIDSTRLAWRWNVSSRKDQRPVAGEDTALKIASTFPQVVAQDQWALEKQQEMYSLPVDGYSEIFIKTDRAVRRVRQVLMEMQRAEHTSFHPDATVGVHPAPSVAA